MKLDFMTRIKIVQLDSNYYVVKATTKRFGNDEIMYEGISEKDCRNYIKEHSIMKITDPLDRNLIWYVKRSLEGHYYLSKMRVGSKRQAYKRMRLHNIEKFFYEKFNLSKEGN